MIKKSIALQISEKIAIYIIPVVMLVAIAILVLVVLIYLKNK